jgi:hypothetical protein
VKNAAGKFLPNANVTAYQITYLNGKIIPQAQSSQATDDRGEYRMFWLPPGDYVVLADPPAYPVGTTPNATAIGGPRGGAPTPGPMSTPQFMRTFYPQSLTTAGSVVIAVKSGDQLSGMDITAQKATTYKISGEIHAGPPTVPVTAPRGRGANADPNAPQKIQVYLGLEYRDPTVIDMRSTNLGGTVPSAGTAVLTTSADGLRATFEVSNVLPGQYYLVPRVTQNFATGAGIFNINRIAVDVDDKDVKGLAIELVPSRNVDGTLTIDGHAPGNVIVRVALSAVGNPSPTYQGITARTAIPKADDGTFTILNIPQTRYLTEMGAGLRRAKLLDQAKIAIVRGERRWELSLDGGMLTYDSLRCPQLGERDAGAQEDPRAAFENDLFLRIADLEDAIDVLDRLYAEFCRLRGSPTWSKQTLPALRAWVASLE